MWIRRLHSLLDVIRQVIEEVQSSELLQLANRELEQFTDLDFFYHLPDDIEQAVETTDPHSAASRRLWWKQ